MQKWEEQRRVKLYKQRIMNAKPTMKSKKRNRTATDKSTSCASTKPATPGILLCYMKKF